MAAGRRIGRLRTFWELPDGLVDRDWEKPDIGVRALVGCFASGTAEFKRHRAGRGHASFFTFHISGRLFNTPLTVLR